MQKLIKKLCQNAKQLCSHVTFHVNMRHTYVYIQHNVNIRGNMLKLFMMYVNISMSNACLQNYVAIINFACKGRSTSYFCYAAY